MPDNIWAETIFPTPEKLMRITEWPVLIGAISIAFIASAETLLCATAVDQMHRGPRTKYDRELTAQGVGNTICGLLGVLPMTGVIVRSGANVEAGAETRASAIMHGVWLLLFVSALPFTLQVHPAVGAGGHPRLHRLQARLSEDRPDAARSSASGEVVIYFVTIIMIVATNLLEGVLVGLGLSLIKLLYAFSHLEVRKEENAAANRVDLYLKGSATLIRLPKLAAELERLKPGANVHVHIDDLDYIDHACLDLLTNWERQHAATGGSADDRVGRAVAEVPPAPRGQHEGGARRRLAAGAWAGPSAVVSAGRRDGAQDQVAGEGRGERAEQHADADLGGALGVGERQHADEQAHGEADAAEDGDAEELRPRRAFRLGGQLRRRWRRARSRRCRPACRATGRARCPGGWRSPRAPA